MMALAFICSSFLVTLLSHSYVMTVMLWISLDSGHKKALSLGGPHLTLVCIG